MKLPVGTPPVRELVGKPRYPPKPEKLPHKCAEYKPLDQPVRDCESCMGEGHRCLLCATVLLHYNNGICADCRTNYAECAGCDRHLPPNAGSLCNDCLEREGPWPPNM